MAINDLNMNTVMVDGDIVPIWDGLNGRTRSVYASTLKQYTSGDSYISLKFDGNNLLGYTAENGWQVVGTIPQTKLSISGGGLPEPAQITGINFSEEFELSIDQLTGEIALKQQTSTIKVDGFPVSEIYTESSINTQLEDGSATFSVNNSVTLWTIHQVGIGDSPYVIDKPEQLGIEYQYEASSQFTQSMHLKTIGLPDGAQVKVIAYGATPESKPIYVTQFRQGGDFTWPVSTPTVFTLRDGLWRVEESSQLLHIQNATTFDDDSALKRIVHGVTTDPDSSITMSVNDDGVLVVGGGGGSGNVDLTGVARVNEENTFTEKQTFDGQALLKGDSEYHGDTTQNKSLMTREAVSIALDNYDKEWLFLASGTLQVVGGRPTGGALQPDTVYMWHSDLSDMTTNPINEMKTQALDAFNTVNGYPTGSTYKFVQGSRAQYWLTNDNGWLTNNTTWHLTAQQAKGNDLVDGEETKIFILLPAEPSFDDDETYSYDGDGFGVPSKMNVSSGIVNQEEITGNYVNNSTVSGDLRIRLLKTKGYKNWRFYYTFPISNLASRKLTVQVEDKPSLDKTVRSGETWLCEVKEGNLYDDFFWQKITDNSSTFEAVDTSGFDVESVHFKPLLKRFTNTDLISIPLTLPDGFSVVVRQVIVRRSSGVESEMGFTYRHDGDVLKIHLNESGSGLIIAGIIVDEI